ncbi:hypothetical protein [Escherichia coli]|uniref:hypothetical protein n=1 Tax=Escherichia coli TaxID=562 RepID=UPI00163D07DA|nr:hypothetical protein [Escherichia coli]
MEAEWKDHKIHWRFAFCSVVNPGTGKAGFSVPAFLSKNREMVAQGKAGTTYYRIFIS